MPKATSLAAAIEKQMGIKVNLVEGSGGILEVRTDDALVYTNKGEASQPYPGDDEMVLSLQSMSQSDIQNVANEVSENTDDGGAPSCSIEPPPIVKSPAPDQRTEIDRMTFACSCAPVPGPEGCACRN